jgi:hypothetical protein
MGATNTPDPQSMARAFGLDRMAERFPDEIERAAEFAKSLADQLPRNLTPADEPAHVFRPTRPGSAV